MQAGGNEPMIKDSEDFSTAENVDTEEDKITDCLNEEVESYFSFPSQGNISSTSLHGNRWENYYLSLIFCSNGKTIFKKFYVRSENDIHTPSSTGVLNNTTRKCGNTQLIVTK